ncbi:MAG: hypothetical protein II000_06245, partial [Clostridia bacterium]|nr:hypothetical protein [Clostridia bacterium]
MKRNQAEDGQRELFRSLFGRFGSSDPDSEETTQILSGLYGLARKKQYADEMRRAEPAAFPVGKLLLSERPKTRKNAARLIGILSLERESDGLIRTLQTERTLYVIPSVILAIGNIGSEACLTALRSYTVPEPSRPEDRKHTEEIADALKKALSRTKDLPVLKKL